MAGPAFPSDPGRQCVGLAPASTEQPAGEAQTWTWAASPVREGRGVSSKPCMCKSEEGGGLQGQVPAGRPADQDSAGSPGWPCTYLVSLAGCRPASPDACPTPRSHVPASLLPLPARGLLSRAAPTHSGGQRAEPGHACRAETPSECRCDPGPGAEAARGRGGPARVAPGNRVPKLGCVPSRLGHVS